MKIRKLKIWDALRYFIFSFAIALGFLTFTGIEKANAQSTNFFVTYGKHLPWAANSTAPNDFMVLTVPPNFHRSWYGYYASDFAKNGGDAATLGIPVLSISDGVLEDVKTTGYNNGAGRYIIINHLNGYKTRYNHMQLVAFSAVDIGKPIRSGQEIGTIGATGNVTRANLEFVMMNSNNVEVKATTDGIPFQGSFSWSQVSPYWETPVDNFDKYRGSIFKSENTLRAADPNPPVINGGPWDPPAYEALDNYLRYYGSMFPAGMVAEPINSATGNFVTSKVDLDLNSQVGTALKFERFYNSQNDYIGFNGIGWSNSYDIKILAHTGNQFSVKLPDGRGETFKSINLNSGGFTHDFESITPESLSKLYRYDDTNGYRFEYTTPDKTKYIFNSDKTSKIWGKIEKIISIDGKTLNFTYTSTGNLEKVTDFAGRFISFDFGTDKTLDSITDSAGRTVQYAYNFDGYLNKVIYPGVGEWNYAYDSIGQITSITDATNKTYVSNVYNDRKVISQKDGNNNWTYFTYESEKDSSGELTGRAVTKVKDGRGSTIEYTHNSELYLVQVTKPGDVITKYEYNDHGQKTKEISPLNREYSYEYYPNGNLKNQKAPLGYSQTFEYNSLNLPTKITDPSGDIIKNYNSIGKIISEKDQLGNETFYEYDTATNFLSKKTNSRNKITTYSYTPEGYVKSEVDAESRSYLNYEYDLAGNRKLVTDSLNRQTKFEFNSLGKNTKIIDPKLNEIKFEYDANGNLIKKIDEINAITSYQTDGNENIIKVIYPNLATEEFKFDANNNVIEEKDRNNNIKKTDFDELNRVIKTSNFDASGNLLKTEEFTYDKESNQTAYKDGRSNTTLYIYDDLNRVKTEVSPSLTQLNYTYDILGRRIETKDYENKSWQSEYDALGRVVKQINPIGSKIEYKYDGVGNLILKTENDTVKTEYTYDSSNRLISIKNPKNNIAKYSYNSVGDLIQTINFAGEVKNFNYDENNNLSSTSDFFNNTTKFIYDARNKVSKIIDPRNNQTQIVYNQMGWKQSEIDPFNKSISYEYDANGNLIKVINKDLSFATTQYDGLNRVISNFDELQKNETYEYDANSNLIKYFDKNKNLTTFEFDKLNRQTKIIGPNLETFTNEFSANGYLNISTDAEGHQTKYKNNDIGKPVEITNSKNITKFINYNQFGQISKETDFKNQASNYEYDELGNIKSITDRLNHKTTFEYDPENRLVETKKPLNSTSKLVYDKAGRLSVEIDPENRITSYEYDAASNISAIKDPKNFSTTFSYDELNRRTQIKNAENGITQYNFDVNSRLQKVIDANNNPTTYIYNARGDLSQVLDARNLPENYSYDDYGNRIKINDRRNNETIFAFDNRNRLIQTNYPDNGIEKISYNKISQIISQTDAKNQATKFEYDELGNIKKVIDRENFAVNYEYDENSNLKKITDAKNAITSFEYNKNDLQIKQTDAYGKIQEYVYDDLDRVIQITNENNQITKYDLNLVNEIIKKTDAQNNITEFTYDKNGNLKLQKDPLLRETKFEYDKINRLKSTINPDLKSKFYTYDNLSNLKSIIDENNNKRFYNYDSVYNLTIAKNALNFSTKYLYDGNNNLIQEIDANNNITEYGYDKRNRLNLKKLPNSEIYKNEYDLNGNLIKEINPKGKFTAYEYTARDQVKKQIDPLLNTTNFEYDSVKNLIKKTDPENNSISYDYDLLKRLIAVTDGMKNTSKYSYDNIGNLITETDPKNQSTKYEFNKLNQLTKEINPANNSWNYEYDKVGNLIISKDPNGNTKNNTFDKLNRLIKTESVSPQNTKLISTFGYDNIGNQIKNSNANITNSYIYDAENQIKEINDSKGKKIKYNYDAVGNRIGITYPDGTSSKYSYNSDNQLNSLTLDVYNGKNLSPDKLTTIFEYDANGNLIKQSNPNLTTTNWAYDDADRLSKIVEKANLPTGKNADLKEYTTADRSYSRNKNGDITNENLKLIAEDQSTCSENSDNENEKEDGEDFEKEKNCNDKFTQNIAEINRLYSYDSNQRLKSYTENVKVSLDDKKTKETKTIELYEYDANSNRTKVNSNIDGKNSAIIFNYNNLNQLISDSNNTYSYDKNGNQTQKIITQNKKVTSFTYNSLNQLISANNKENNLAGSYTYDALDRRITKKADATTAYTYDGLGWESLTETKTKDYTNFYKVGSKIIASQKVDTKKDYSTRGKELEKALKENSKSNTDKYKLVATPEIDYYYYDNLGSVTAISGIKAYTKYSKGKNPVSINLSALGQINYYDAWGNLKNEDIKLTGSKKVFSIDNNKTYSGKELDIETGNYYYGSRYYNPKTANWNKQDSYRGQITNPISRNRYGFVNDNPVNNVDLYGFCDLPGTSKFASCPNQISKPIPTTGCNIDRSCQNNPGPNIDSIFGNANNQLNGTKSSIDTTTTNLNSNKNSINSALPGLAAQVTATKWNAYFSKIKYYDYTVLNSVINRLNARGYSMNYSNINNFLGNQISITGNIYAQANNSYHIALNNYSGAVNVLSQINNNLNQLSQLRTKITLSITDLQNLYTEAKRLDQIAGSAGYQAFNNSVNSMQSLNLNSSILKFTNSYSPGFTQKFESIFGTNQVSPLFASNYIDGYSFSQKNYYDGIIADIQLKNSQAALNKGMISFIKIGAAVVGATACTVVTAGIALVGCVGLAGVVVANESVNLYDYNASASSGVNQDTKANMLSGIMSQNNAKVWSGYINLGSDLALAGTITIATAGTGSVLFTGNSFTMSGLTAYAMTVPGASQVIAIEGIGAFGGNYANIYCLNTMQCSSDQLALNTLASISGAGTIGGNAGLGTIMLQSSQGMIIYNRQNTVGGTPGKNTPTGRIVIDSMAAQGKIRNGFDGLEFQATDGSWYPINKADMAHKTDAVTWWNQIGRFYGAKSPQVRDWMLDPNNYYLEHYSINRSQGARIQ